MSWHDIFLSNFSLRNRSKRQKPHILSWKLIIFYLDYVNLIELSMQKHIFRIKNKLKIPILKFLSVGKNSMCRNFHFQTALTKKNGCRLFKVG